MITIRQHVKYAEYITNFLDTKFNVFGLRIGIDPFLDVIPVVGPMIGGCMSLYILWIAWRLNVSIGILIRMVLNISIDYVIGLIPFIGFFGDWFYKANVRNMMLLKKNVDSEILVGELVEE